MRDDKLPAAVVVDAAGGLIGGAARFKVELRRYLARTGRGDVRVIGAERQVSPVWLLRREFTAPRRGRRVALNNVSFMSPGGERWALLRNPLDFLTGGEEAGLSRGVRLATRRRAPVVHVAAQRADVLVVPSTGMAMRVARILPRMASRIVIRPHPVSADAIPSLPREPIILCPVLFSPYKEMPDRLAELLTALDQATEESVRLCVTAEAAEMPAQLSQHPRIKLVGRLDHLDLRQLWARSQVIYFPPGIESFGYPLAEARVYGRPVIARDTEQNREIAGHAMCGFKPGDLDSVCLAVKRALAAEIAPDPAPFDPDAYFHWLLGAPR
jgi:glycosyltransferase involved in cell wall biosynthesis